MPISLEEFTKLPRTTERQKGGRKVDWNETAHIILESNKYFTVKEVHKLVDEKVTAFRCKNALDTLCERKVLDRRYDGKRFWYGPPIKDD